MGVGERGEGDDGGVSGGGGGGSRGRRRLGREEGWGGRGVGEGDWGVRVGLSGHLCVPYVSYFQPKWST